MHASDQALGEPSPDAEKLSCPIWVVRPRAAQPPYVPDERSDHQRAGPLDGDTEITVGQALASTGEYRRVQASTGRDLRVGSCYEASGARRRRASAVCRLPAPTVSTALATARQLPTSTTTRLARVTAV